MGALREPKLLKLEVRTPQNMVLYSKSATTSLSNICYNCIVPISVKVNFNDKTQYEGVVDIPFKNDSSGIESVSIDNNASPSYKYYNIFGVEVDNSYRGIVITSDGRKILKK